MKRARDYSSVALKGAPGFFEILLAAFCLAENTQSQGVFLFTNHGSVSYRAPVFDTDCITPLAGDAYLIQPYVGLTPDALQPLGAIQPFRTGLGAGYFDPVTVTVPGTFADRVYVQERAWASAAGATYEAAVGSGGKHGVSNIVPVLALPNTAVDPQITSGFESFCLIPEPPSWALGLLGASVLWLTARVRSRNLDQA